MGFPALAEALVKRLPLPLAQLSRRAYNAKTPQDRLHHGWCLAEAALKLTAAARIGVALSGGLAAASPLAVSLERLCLPSLSDWLDLLRQALDSLAARPDEALLPLGKVNRELLHGSALASLPALQAVLPEDCQSAGPLPHGETVLDFFDLVSLGRSVLLPRQEDSRADRLDQTAAPLLAVLQELLEQPCLLGGLTLAVARLTPAPSGRAVQLEWQALHGLSSLVLSPEDVGPEPRAARPGVAGQVYLVGPGVRVPLHPLLVYQEDRQERERVLFLHRGRPPRPRSDAAAPDGDVCCYLDYLSGELLAPDPLRQDLRALLAQLRGRPVGETDLDALATSPGRPAPAASPTAAVVLGDFELLEEQGRGAMGIVYRARQRSLDRPVALKVLLPALAADPLALKRFAREIEALARCDHAHLVKILFSGNEGDRHYYAMELVEGATLAELWQLLSAWRQQLQRPLRESHLAAALAVVRDPGRQTDSVAAPPGDGEGRLLVYRLIELFADAAEALAHLHARGILHRDLKPANLMLSDEGRLVIMDLGVARLRDGSHGVTRSGTRWVGTLRYCAPEQLQWQSQGTDERADVYGLGATLYELATLHPLFEGDSESVLLEQVLRRPPRDPRKLEPAVPRDLRDLLLACLDKDRGARYPQARDLADDLRRLSQGRPLALSPASPRRRLLQWARRNPLLAGLSAAVLVLLTLVAAGSALAALRIAADKADLEQQAGLLHQASADLERSRDEARNSARQAIAQRNEARQRTVELEQARAAATLTAAREGRARRRAEQVLYFQQVARAEREWLDGNVAAAERLLDDCLPWLRHWEWRYVRRLCRGERLLFRNGHHGAPLAVAFSPDGRRLATAGGDRTFGNVRVYDTATGRELLLTAKHDSRILHVAFSPDGRYLLTAGGDRIVALWDSRREPLLGRPLRTFDTGGRPTTGLTFRPGTSQAAIVTQVRDGPGGRVRSEVSIWDVESGKKVLTLEGLRTGVWQAAFSPDGGQLATACGDGAVRTWDATTGRRKLSLEGHPGPVLSLAYSADGKRLATGSTLAEETGQVRLWNLETQEVALTFGSVPGGLVALAFDPSGKRLAGCGVDDATVKLWDAASGAEVMTLRGHTREVHGLAFSPAGGQLATASADQTVRLWDTTDRTDVRLLRDTGDRIHDLAFSPDGRLLATAGADGAVWIWDRASGKKQFRCSGHASPAVALAFSPDGRLLASASRGKQAPRGVPVATPAEVRVWDARTGQPVRTLGAARLPVCFSPDGRLLLAGSATGTLSAWDVATGREKRGLAGGRKWLGLSGNGRWLVCQAQEGGVEVWELPRGVRRRRLAGVDVRSRAGQVVVSNDGHWLAHPSDKDVRVWDLVLGREQARWVAGTEDVDAVAFSPDGQRLVTAARGDRHSRVRVWDTTTGILALALRCPGEGVTRVRFSPDGHHLAAACAPLFGKESPVYLWEAFAGPAPVTLHASDWLQDVAFTPDGRRLIAAGLSSRLACWDLEHVESIPQRTPVRPVQRLALSPDGRRLALAQEGGWLEVLDLAAGKRLFEQRQKGAERHGLAFSPDGRWLATTVSAAGAGRVLILEAATGRLVRSLDGHRGEAWAVAFSPDGKRLVSTGGDFREGKYILETRGDVFVWETAGWKQVAAHKGELDLKTSRGIEDGHVGPVYAVAFSGDGRTFATGDTAARVKVWDAATGAELRAFRAAGPIHAVALSPGGRWLAAGCWDGTVRLWEVRGERERILSDHTGQVWAVAFSPDGKRLASAGWDSTVRVWDMAALDRLAPVKRPE